MKKKKLTFLGKWDNNKKQFNKLGKGIYNLQNICLNL